MATKLQDFGLLAENRPGTHGENLLMLGEGSTPGPLNEELTLAGYSLRASCWKEVLPDFPFVRPDLILLSVSVPDRSGKQVLRELREWTTAPVIVISEKADMLQSIEFLDIGADDYLTEPFQFAELLARLRAALRRAAGRPPEIFDTGGLEVDFSRREVRVEHRRVKLSWNEYELLKILAAHAGMVQTHYQLIHEVWGGTRYQDAPHLLRVTVCNLRRKLLAGSSLPDYIETEPGIGYRLRCD